MMKAKARLKGVAYIGWRGIQGCEVLEFGDGPLIGLLGQSGAGKTTLALCLANALLPDRQVLDIQPISEVTDMQSVGTDILAGKIDPQSDFAYVVLDILTRQGQRLIAGIYAQKIDERAKLTRWIIKNVSEEISLKDLMVIEENEDQVYYPAFPKLKKTLAVRGIDVEECKTIGEYGQALYEAGVLPSSMRNRTDRSLYANLLKTTFRGGLSGEVTSRLKDYLLTGQAQVPDIVRGLQECADEIFKTRNAIADAEKELALLKSTYGSGREVVAISVRWLFDEKELFEGEREAEANSLSEFKAREGELVESIAQLQDDIQRTNDEKKEATDNAVVKINSLNAELQELTKNAQKVRDVLREARNEKNKYQVGQDLWLQLEKLCLAESYDDAWQWLEGHVKDQEGKRYKIRSEINDARNEIQRLELGKPSVASEALANSIGGETLDRRFGSLSERDALVVELSLSGLTDGVVGVKKSALSELAFSKELPETFWIGKSEPAIHDTEIIGEWLVSPSRDGYVATHNGRTSIFGDEAKKTLQKRLLKKVGSLIESDKALSRELNAFTNNDDGLKTLFSREIDKIKFYLKQRESFELANRVESLDQKLQLSKQKIAALEGNIQKAQEAAKKVAEPFDKLIDGFQITLISQNKEIGKLQKSIEQAQERLGSYKERLKNIYYEEDAVKKILGDEFDLLYELGLSIEDFDLDDAIDLAARKLANLCTILVEEVPERADFLNNITAKDRVKTVSLWPLLLEIVRERINIDLANSDGLDLIQKAKDRRADLSSELVDHESNAKAKARGIANTIKSTINTSKLRIDKLSRLGHEIHFGNIIGVRLRLVTKTEMVALLESFSGQLSLFSNNIPIDVAIKEWFSKRLGEGNSRMLKGEDLLDYRNYVDFVVEAKWKGGDWESIASASLSGGESIGCGLALALMLMRSIASRGEVKPELITPLFAMDEIHRLDDAGVEMIVNLAKRENFQIVVTAQKMTPSYDCTLFNLTRVHDPDLLIIRGIRVNTEKIAA